MKIFKCRVFSILLTSSLSALFLVTSAQAQTFGPYLKLDGGANLVKDTSAQIGGAPGNLSLDAGFRVDGAVGYEFNRWLAVEVEGGYLDNSIDSVSLNNQAAHPRNSSLSGVPLLGNVVLRYENSSDFVPYLGAGAGGLFSWLKIADTQATDIVFAYQAKIGVIYKIEDRAWVDVGYKLLVTQEQNYTVGGTQVQTDKILNHFFGASIVWRF